MMLPFSDQKSQGQDTQVTNATNSNNQWYNNTATKTTFNYKVNINAIYKMSECQNYTNQKQ